MLPLLLAGLVGILPFLPSIFKIPDHWDFRFSFLSFGPSQRTLPKTDLLYFYLDPGSLPDVDVAISGGKLLPPLLFPVVSGPHCTAESGLDFVPQPVCFAIVDDPEFLNISPIIETDTFVFPWDRFKADNLVYVSWCILIIGGAIYCLYSVIPYQTMEEIEERAYTYLLAYHAHGIDGLRAALLGDSIKYFVEQAGFGDDVLLAGQDEIVSEDIDGFPSSGSEDVTSRSTSQSFASSASVPSDAPTPPASTCSPLLTRHVELPKSPSPLPTSDAPSSALPSNLGITHPTTQSAATCAFSNLLSQQGTVSRERMPTFVPYEQSVHTGGIHRLSNSNATVIGSSSHVGPSTSPRRLKLSIAEIARRSMKSLYVPSKQYQPRVSCL
jgi:hypothetical protein